eukprot:TRINITY_DN17961_c0_g1_i1.p1 TRINITY_DN17961_c0_g1~~TRINITY_DN17961_c0_g1_i1.p1  ORF type:complete len:407 (-),score=70.65 TRINITY_DN17961_c0_g1_i1:342-1562(-)
MVERSNRVSRLPTFLVMLVSTSESGSWDLRSTRASDLVDAALGPFAAKLTEQSIRKELDATDDACVRRGSDVEDQKLSMKVDRCRQLQSHYSSDTPPQPSTEQENTVEKQSADHVRERKPADTCNASLSKDRALALQMELLAAFTTPAFQRELYELARLQNAVHRETVEYRRAMRQIVRSVQLPILARYGFQPSEQGVIEMQQAFREFKEDAEIYVNSQAIQEALLSSPLPAVAPQEPLEKKYAFGTARKPCNQEEVLRLLRDLLTNYSEPEFQACLQELKEIEASHDECLESEGFYQLPGRDELAFKVQKILLPYYGFEASREGVKDMIQNCSKYLKDPEVSSLFDSINIKLGMSRAACRRFRKFASSLTSERNQSCLKGADTWHKCLSPPLGAYRSGLVLTPTA